MPLIALTTSSAGPWSRPVPSEPPPKSLTTTLAPCWAMRSAISRPIPRAAPVTNATLSFSIGVAIGTPLSSLSVCSSDDAACRQALDLCRVEPGFPQDIPRVLAERGRTRPDRARGFRERDGGADGREAARARVRLLDDHPARHHGRVLHQRSIVVDGRAEHVDGLESGHPFLDGAAREHGLEERDELLAVVPAIGGRDESRIVGELGPSDELAEGPPRVVFPHRDEDPGVLGVEGLIGNDLRVATAVAGKRLARLVKDGEPGRVREQDAIEQGYVHSLPFTRATAADERGQDALDGEEAAHGVGHGRPYESRAAVGVSRDGHEPAHRLRERVQAG